MCGPAGAPLATTDPIVTPPLDLARLTVRDPGAALQTLRQQWRGHAQWWIFGYASLIWRPEFDAAEHRPALVHGWHRALRMRSRVNRGTPQQPGLVFALLPGGACRGVVYRMRPENAEAELEKLWDREMPTGVYAEVPHPDLRRGVAKCLSRLTNSALLGLFCA